MVNRVSTSGRYDMLFADMQQNLINYNKITKQLASGSKVTSITDDPIAAVNILNTSRQLGQLDIFGQNIELGKSELNAFDDLLGVAIGYLSSTWDRAVQANNQTYGKSSLAAIKVEVDENIKTMVDLANTEFNDNYIFGGTNTKITPYVIAENGDIVYRGTPYDNKDYIRQTEVADGVFEVINTTGDKIFGYYREAVKAGQGVWTDANGKRVIESTENGATVYRYENGNLYGTGTTSDGLTDGAPEEAYGVMGAMKLFSNSLQMVIDSETADDEVPGYELMNSTLDRFKNALTQMTEEQTKFGGVYNRLEMTTSAIETNNENLTAYLSSINDVDIATAITNWMQAQYAYQASLQVSSSAMGMSLLNYL